MNADSLIPGRFIKAVDLGSTLAAEPTFTITAVVLERVPDLKNPGNEVVKGIVGFRDIEQGWVMNRTNVECLKAMFGPETDGWMGKRVTLCQETVKMPKGPDELGIRVKGSPDIDREIVAQWKPKRKSMQSRRLVPTGSRPQRQPDRAPEPPKPAADWRDEMVTAASKYGLTEADLAAVADNRPRAEWVAADVAAMKARINRAYTESRAAADPPSGK